MRVECVGLVCSTNGPASAVSVASPAMARKRRTKAYPVNTRTRHPVRRFVCISRDYNPQALWGLTIIQQGQAQGSL
eukprot:6191073-Pleurochrysis_carterae.AAC.2